MDARSGCGYLYFSSMVFLMVAPILRGEAIRLRVVANVSAGVGSSNLTPTASLQSSLSDLLGQAAEEERVEVNVSEDQEEDEAASFEALRHQTTDLDMWVMRTEWETANRSVLGQTHTRSSPRVEKG